MNSELVTPVQPSNEFTSVILIGKKKGGRNGNTFVNGRKTISCLFMYLIFSVFLSVVPFDNLLGTDGEEGACLVGEQTGVCGWLERLQDQR